MNRLTDKRLATEYAYLLAGFARNGVLDRQRLPTDGVGTWLAGSAAGRDSFEGDPKIATVAACQRRLIMNLLLVLMVFAIWFLTNHHGLFTVPP